jgi:hypothetical protein
MLSRISIPARTSHPARIESPHNKKEVGAGKQKTPSNSFIRKKII